MPNNFSIPFIQTALFGIVVWCYFLLLPNAVQSAISNSVTLQWAANSESDLAGYRVYRGTTPGVYGLSIDVGNVTAYTIANLPSDSTYYFAITAYDWSGNESLPSQEVSKNISNSSGNNVLSYDFNADFNDGNFTGWQVVNEGTWDAPSAWTVVGGALQQSSNIYDGNTDGTVLPKNGTFAWYTNGLGWSNYQVAVQMRSTDDDAMGIMVRYQNPTNYYRFSWDAQRLYRRLVKVVNGTVTLLRQDAVPYVVGQTYQVEVVADGNTLEVRVDGVSLFGGPMVDSALSTGSVALYSWGNIGSVFDNVHVGPVDVPPILSVLTVTRAGTGGGTVNSSPAGITCRSICAANFASGTPVTLTAIPDGDSKFDGWSGDADCSDGQVTMTKPLSCMPTFTASLIQDVTPPSIFLTSPTNGDALSGTVNVNASATDNIGVVGVQFQLNGTNLGTEDKSTPFSISWNTTGVVPGQYTLTAIARDAAGNFTTSIPIKTSIPSPPLTLSVSIGGGGTITSNPNGIHCSNGTCSASYGSGSTITLSAKADKKWNFSGWSGACSGTGECVILLSKNQVVGATFLQNGNGRGNK